MDESLQRHLTHTNDVADVLRRAKALIGAPERWLHGNGAWSNGRRCIGCALIHANQGDETAMAWFPAEHNRELLAQFAKAAGIGNDLNDVFRFNASSSTTHAEVMAAFDRAIALAEQEAAVLHDPS